MKSASLFILLQAYWNSRPWFRFQ